MSKDRIFADSNVIITSLLSKKGASYLLLNQPNKPWDCFASQNKFIISNVSKKELERVADRLEITQDKLHSLIQKRLKTVRLTSDLTKIKKDFEDYTSDPNDAHIVAGAAKAKAKFLLTYDIRDFNRQKISEDFGITILTPAQYLQYLRSLE